MIPVLGENYYIDLDKIEEYLDMREVTSSKDETEEGGETSSEMRINLVKFELVKMLLETILIDEGGTDEKLGMKNNANNNVAFKIAFNSLLNKKLINHY